MTDPRPHIVDDDEAIRDGLQWLFKTRNLASSTWPSAEVFLDAVQPDWQSFWMPSNPTGRAAWSWTSAWTA